MRLPPPTTKDATLETVMATLPNFHQASLQMSITWQLGRRQPTMVRARCPGSRGRGQLWALQFRGHKALSCFFSLCPRWLWASMRRSIFRALSRKLCWRGSGRSWLLWIKRLRSGMRSWTCPTSTCGPAWWRTVWPSECPSLVVSAPSSTQATTASLSAFSLASPTAPLASSTLPKSSLFLVYAHREQILL